MHFLNLFNMTITKIKYSVYQMNVNVNSKCYRCTNISKHCTWKIKDDFSSFGKFHRISVLRSNNLEKDSWFSWLVIMWISSSKVMSFFTRECNCLVHCNWELKYGNIIMYKEQFWSSYSLNNLQMFATNFTLTTNSTSRLAMSSGKSNIVPFRNVVTFSISLLSFTFACFKFIVTRVFRKIEH